VEEGLRAVVGLWRGSYFKIGENENPYYLMCFDKKEPLAEELRMTAKAVLSRLIACRNEIREVHLKNHE
jgi:hypothetical protein